MVFEKNKQKEKQEKGTPSQGASENKRRKLINKLAKHRIQHKSFKYNKVYLHRYRKENLEQKNRT